MIQEIQDLRDYFVTKLDSIDNFDMLKELSDELLGKKWRLNAILKWLKDLSIDEKREVWKLSNDFRDFINDSIDKKSIEIEALEFDRINSSENIDVSLEYPLKNRWHRHPLSIWSRLLEDIFISLWFKVEDWPHIESEEYNFDKLNIPDDHPARDVWDTFWLSDDLNATRDWGDKLLLRTHTSPVQIRTMLREVEKTKQTWDDIAIKIVVPGRVYRYEQEDRRHTANFYQLEWLVVWKWVTFWDLKWTLDTRMKTLLWEGTKTRFRPSIFPFTEPSREVDVTCQICKWTWDGCSMCSGTGWVELLGSGMVHPKVLEYCGIDPREYSGFAFGMGIDRITSQRFEISSARMLYQNKLELNKQF